MRLSEACTCSFLTALQRSRKLRGGLCITPISDTALLCTMVKVKRARHRKASLRSFGSAASGSGEEAAGRRAPYAEHNFFNPRVCIGTTTLELQLQPLATAHETAVGVI